MQKDLKFEKFLKQTDVKIQVPVNKIKETKIFKQFIIYIELFFIIILTSLKLYFSIFSEAGDFSGLILIFLPTLILFIIGFIFSIYSLVNFFNNKKIEKEEIVLFCISLLSIAVVINNLFFKY